LEESRAISKASMEYFPRGLVCHEPRDTNRLTDLVDEFSRFVENRASGVSCPGLFDGPPDWDYTASATGSAAMERFVEIICFSFRDPDGFGFSGEVISTERLRACFPPVMKSKIASAQTGIVRMGDIHQ
jgi:hypothetical protein